MAPTLRLGTRGPRGHRARGAIRRYKGRWHQAAAQARVALALEARLS